MNFLSLFLKFAKSQYICYRLTLRIRKKRDAYLTKLLPERSYIIECGGQGEESVLYKQFVGDPNTEEQKIMLDRIFVLNYDDNVTLKRGQVYIYYQTSVLHEVLKDKYRNDYFDKLSKWILFPSF